ncbi:nicotinate phosphoribosyltransferase [bacterium]|nr:nicotinate phosphoribosyltransferase [bacterium]
MFNWWVMPPQTPLFTDLYELTMAQAWWHCGRADQTAVFHLSYRQPPPGVACVLACGQAAIADWSGKLKFSDDDAAYLGEVTGSNGQPLFRPGFIDWLQTTPWQCQIDAASEGTAVFPGAPLLRVTGPLAQAQIMETALLNAIGMPSLVATQAARLALAAGNDPVLDFGLRSAQGPDGGLSASRAAWIGGCAATSNTLAGKRFGIPVKGTHAHAWVMSFDDEQAAFDAYADAFPDDTIALVDTYDTRLGLERAVATGLRLQQAGHSLAGVRLDSGDLDALSRHARQTLDDAGLTDTRIVASGDLDPDKIQRLKAAGAPIDAWGVGSNLATGGPSSTLDVVYKLGATRDGDTWTPRLKLSDSPAKQSLPGVLSVLRHASADRSMDVVVDDRFGGPEPPAWADTSELLLQRLVGGDAPPRAPLDATRDHAAKQATRYLYEPSHTVELAASVQQQLESLSARVRP